MNHTVSPCQKAREYWSSEITHPSSLQTHPRSQKLCFSQVSILAFSYVLIGVRLCLSNSGAQTYMNGNKVYVFDVEIIEDKQVVNRDVGKVLFVEDSFPCVVCGKGLLKILKMEDQDGNSLLPFEKFRTRLL